MDSIRQRDRRAKSKQRLQNELEKVLRRSEFANKSFPEETSKGLSTYDYQETTTSSPLTLEDIAPMETSHSLDAGAHVDVIEDPVSMTQFPILEDIAEEDDCVMEEADKEGIVLQNDETTELSGVCDEAVYRKLVRTQRDPFIILTLNINGISIFQSSNRSIWIFTAAINEVARQDRFKLNNMLILAISSSLCDKASTGKTMICVFPTAPTITYSLRTNEWYDQMIETVCNPRRILVLLFDDKYAKQKWPCKNKMESIQVSLDKIHYPSNTTRIPRPLIFFKKYKGSELRTLLLFGIFAFREGLNELHYKREYFTADT
ncbi:unnamed protein product [Rotaria sordida]|uniref:Uncharacterized protein n=1 Tax=Rotaria sordida TaxID=392033 RepID=A0A815KQ80_9BILA|nr:unnamed protein product [Rotaria sordida]